MSLVKYEVKINMKKIAIVTGGTGGIGKEFVKQFVELKKDLDEIWVLGRNQGKLDKIKNEFGEKIYPVSCDLSDEKNVTDFIKSIKESDVCIKYLVNSAGLAKMARCCEFDTKELSQTIDLNCKTVVLLCHECIQKMMKGSRILNLSSASSFQPNPYIAIYSASKVFVKNYSRALNYELKDMGVTCTAVCPGWVDTDMLEKERNGKTIKFPGVVTAERVVKLAIKDADKGKDMSVCSLYVKYEHLFSKIMPNRLVMKIWAKGVEKYL